jgi:hypothetical protein
MELVIVRLSFRSRGNLLRAVQLRAARFLPHGKEVGVVLV